MARAHKEWIGATDDSQPPPRVRLRVFLAFDGVCQCGCGIKIDNKPWELDHRIAIINEGKNRESNLHPLLKEHHREKTKLDSAEKSKTYKKRLKNYGVKKSKWAMPGSRASGWKRKMDGSWVKR